MKKQDISRILKRLLCDQKDKENTVEQSPMPQDSGIDKKILEDVKNLMGDKFGTMVEKFIENSTHHIAQAEEAIGNNDAKLLADSTHALKSSSASIGMVNVASLAKEIEAEADHIHETGEGELSNLSQTVQELRQAFEGGKGVIIQEASQKT